MKRAELAAGMKDSAEPYKYQILTALSRWKPIWSDLQDQIEEAYNRGEDTVVLNKMGPNNMEVFLQYDFKKMVQVAFFGFSMPDSTV
jgi:hypothetical protein